MRKALSGLACFTFFLIVFAYYQPQLLFHPQSYISDHGDGILNYWMLAHGFNKIRDFSFLSFWDGNIFFPLSSTMALSDTLLFQILFVSPFRYLGLPLIAGYNLSIPFFFAVNGLCCYFLFLELTESKGLAYLGSGLAVINAFWFARMPHYQLLPVFWYPLALLFLLHYFKQKKIKYWVFHSISLVGLAFSSPYLFLLFIPAIFIVYSAFLLKTKLWKDMRSCLRLGLILGLCFFIIGVYYQPYLQVKSLFGLVRNLGEQSLYSASWPAFSSHQGLQWPSKLLGPDLHYGEGQIYLSFIIRIFLPFFSLIFLFKKIRNRSIPSAPFMDLAFVLLGVFFLAALGPDFEPYALNIWRKFNLIPGFSGIRVPARVGFQIYLYSAAALILLLKSLKFTRYLWIVAPAGLVFLVLEMQREPSKDFIFQDKSILGLVDFMEKQNKTEPAIFYPVEDMSLDFFVIAAKLKNHFLNGRSGFTPSIHEQFILPNVANCTTEACLYILKRFGIHLVIVRKDSPDMKQIDAFLRNSMKVLYEDSAYVLLENFSLKDESIRGLTSEKELLAELPKAANGMLCSQTMEVYDSDGRSIEAVLDNDFTTRWTSGKEQGQGLFLTIKFRQPVLGKFVIQLMEKSERLATSDFARKPQVTALDEGDQLIEAQTWIDLSQKDGKVTQWLGFDAKRPVTQIKIEALSIPANTGWWSVDEASLCR